MPHPLPANNRNRVRIIGGQWRSRVLQFPDGPGLRPTPDRVRETLFNWLQLRIHGARCLDLFAGSGALGLEALSRGAASVVALETSTAAATALRQNVSQLGTTSLQLIQQDALRWLDSAATQQFDIVFIDPPFADNTQGICCELLQKRGWLTAGALIYLEAGNELSALPLPTGWQLSRNKRAGDVFYALAAATEPSL